MKRAMVVIVVLLACLTGAGADDELEIVRSWQGVVHLPLTDRALPPPQVLRSQADFERFVASIPSHEISMTRPSPPSKDPLLARPRLDFKRCTAIVVFTDFIYATPTVTRVVARKDGVAVTVRRTEPPDARQMQYPLGVGRYQMVLVPRFQGGAVEP
jgi:hypothetical protein